MKNTVAVTEVREVSPNIAAEEEAAVHHDKDNFVTEASYWNSLYSLVIVVATILNAAIVTSIPRENSIIYQDIGTKGFFVSYFALFSDFQFQTWFYSQSSPRNTI